MCDDLGKLPGDDKLEPKCKGLRRLRKAERSLLKNEQQNQPPTPAAPPASGRSGKKSTVTVPPPSATAAADTNASIGPTAKGEGRHWERRRWRTTGLSNLARVLLAAGATVAAAEDATVDFCAIFDGVKVDVAAADHKGDTTAGDNGDKTAPATSGGKKGKKRKGSGKDKETTAVDEGEGGREEGEEQAAAKKKKEEREADVLAWAERVRGAFEGETFVTTAHRAAVAARDAIVVELADRTKVRLGVCLLG